MYCTRPIPASGRIFGTRRLTKRCETLSSREYETPRSGNFRFLPCETLAPSTQLRTAIRQGQMGISAIGSSFDTLSDPLRDALEPRRKQGILPIPIAQSVHVLLYTSTSFPRARLTQAQKANPRRTALTRQVTPPDRSPLAPDASAA